MQSDIILKIIKYYYVKIINKNKLKFNPKINISKNVYLLIKKEIISKKKKKILLNLKNIA